MADFDQENMPPVGNKAPKYQKKTQLEHILLRPDTYIGSVESEVEPYWVAAPESADGSARMEYRKIGIVPGLYKIFDEILVNAADNKQRDSGKVVMGKLEVTIDSDRSCITVKNDGQGISVAKHDEYPMHIPQLIFGELLTSSNYDDDVKQTVGGRNGFGAKLANIFSNKFVVEIEDATSGKRYTQVWRNNMSVVEAPTLVSYSGSKNSTSITFYPELRRFGMDRFDADLLALLCKRVYDIAGTTSESLKVYLNGAVLPVRGFKDYLGLYLGSDASQRARVHAQIDRRWEVCVALNDNEQFAQVSFVNNIATARGGTHVNYAQDVVVKAILELIAKHKGAGKSAKELTATDVKRHLFLFVNALIVNPTFDSQTKTNLTTKRADLDLCVDPITKKLSKQKLELPDAVVKKIKESGLVEEIISRATEKAEKKLAKTDGKKMQRRLTGIPKLEDANLAGTKDAHLCTLILTEGDSAKALAVSGLSVVGRDRYGVFPLKGKLLNVREASASQLLANAEVTALKQILGLQAGKKYSDNRQLRYGRVMIMADQDHDGSHIKGLVINLFAHCWPSLLELSSPSSFLWEFITPIVKVSRGVSAAGVASAKAKEVLFYSMPDFESWKGANQDGKGWTTKYYKGLGTSTANEAKAYFSELERHMIEFQWDPRSKDALELAFSSKAADARKDWLGSYRAGQDGIDQSGFGQRISYSDFVDKELILFSMASNQRAIPSLVDGLKPGQRKILFCAFKRGLRREVKVAQLAGYVSEHSAYHHGEQSLCSTIVGLAQGFVGNNNLPLLLPLGQFGTRLQGGKDAASARYIFTALNPVTRFVYPQADDALLTHLWDDGQQIEPEWYCPVLPMVLVNGSSGIGTGWSSDVPNYSPRDIVSHLRTMIDIERNMPGCSAAAGGKVDPAAAGRLEAAFVSQLPELQPWYKGFTGVIKGKGLGRFVVKGTIERLPSAAGGGGASIHISELPLHVWTGEYKLVLEAMLSAGEIREFKEYHTDTTVSFVVDLTPEQMQSYESGGMTLYKKFKLNSSLATSNMVLFTRDGKLKRYTSANDILIDFFHVRLEYYHARKAALLAAHKAEADKLANKVRFIRAVCGLSEEKIVVTNRAKKDIVAQLDRAKYLRIPKKLAAKKTAGEEEDDAESAEALAAAAEEEEEELAAASSKSGAAAAVPRASDYDYLMSMDLWALSKEKAAALMAELAASQASLAALEATAPSDMWLRDLDAFMLALDAQEQLEKKLEDEAAEKCRLKRLGVKATSAAAKAALLKSAVIRGEVIVDYSDDFDETKVKVPRKKKAAVDANAPISIEALMLDDDDDAATATAAAKPAAAAAKSTKTKKLAPSTAAAAAATGAAAKKPAAGKKSKKAVSSDDEDESMDDFSDDDEEGSSASPVAVVPRSRPGRAAAAKATYVDKSDEDDDEEDDEEDLSVDEEDEDEEEEEQAPAPKAKAKAAAAKKPAAAVAKKSKKKRSTDSDEEDEESDSDFDDAGEDDESDFEIIGAKKGKKAAPAPAATKPKPAAKKAAAAAAVAPVAAPVVAAATAAAALPKKAAPKKQGKAKKKKDDDSESEVQSDSEASEDDADFESSPVAKKKAPAKKAAAAPKAAGKKAAAAAAAPAAVAAAAALVKDVSEMSLMERMAARFASVEIAAVPAAAAAANASKHRAAPSTPPKKGGKREKEAKASQLVMASPASPDPKRRKLYNADKAKQLIDLIPPTPVQDAKPAKATKAAKTAAAAKPAKAAAASKKGSKKAAVSDDDDDEADAPAPAAAAAVVSSRPQRAAKPTKSYVEKSDDEEEEEEEDVSVEELSDDDDYEE